jgi:hypothetical protein
MAFPSSFRSVLLVAQMPTYPDDLGPDIRKKHEENEGGVIVTVMCSMGEEHVISAKIDASA